MTRRLHLLDAASIAADEPEATASTVGRFFEELLVGRTVCVWAEPPLVSPDARRADTAGPAVP
ncbi:hypothetical protein [Streptomyces sp. SudanB182_2057]|uniref:hypothetical protein n=1 Tax=Streptomyces sp. SudanB182_2057 TaxID=3035281 RepID=UPI003F567B2E